MRATSLTLFMCIFAYILPFFLSHGAVLWEGGVVWLFLFFSFQFCAICAWDERRESLLLDSFFSRHFHGKFMIVRDVCAFQHGQVGETPLYPCG